MKLDCPGLICEKLPSGSYRWRVRVAGRKSQRITLTIDPDHPDFQAHYTAARAGKRADAPAAAPEAPKTLSGSVAALVDSYLAAMPSLHLDPETIKNRSYFLRQLREEFGDFDRNMGQSDVLRMRDARSATPGAADNFVKTIRAMYGWACDRNIVEINPGVGIPKINRGKGATPWTVADLKQYRERHPPGTMAYLALTLFMFTAGRISEVYRMGRANEIERGGKIWLDWMPQKAGAKRVLIPMMPALLEATRAMTVQHPTAYLLTEYGQPFRSSAAFSNKFRDWCDQASLTDRSSHGIRKAAGELLALYGATQYQIMAIHGHSSAKTSQIYTQGAERASLAAQGMDLLAGLDW